MANQSAGTLKILIIGGGASGVLLACNLLRSNKRNVRVTLIEKTDEIGRGIAYGATNDQHVLNVRASNMSAFSDQPDHFWRWLSTSEYGTDPRCADPSCFAPRHIYGCYLQSLIAPYIEDDAQHRRLHIVEGECIDITETETGISARLADGSSHMAHIAVLATGNEAAGGAQQRPCESGWNNAADLGIKADDPVLIIGSGLTMVDHVTSLIDAGHHGSISIISRRGLIPAVHARNQAMMIDRADVPLGTNLHYITRWLRKLIAQVQSHGGGWRDVIDGLRPHTQAIWQSWSSETRERFLRHGRAWWDVHRHRMSPQADTCIRNALQRGQLRVIAGRVMHMDAVPGGGVDTTYVPRGNRALETMRVARVIECTGAVLDPTHSANPLIISLLRNGQARADPVGIGLDISAEGALIDRHGHPSQRLYAIGPITRAAFWEIVAIPDIRVQCAQLSNRLL